MCSSNVALLDARSVNGMGMALHARGGACMDAAGETGPRRGGAITERGGAEGVQFIGQAGARGVRYTHIAGQQQVGWGGA